MDKWWIWGITFNDCEIVFTFQSSLTGKIENTMMLSKDIKNRLIESNKSEKMYDNVYAMHAGTAQNTIKLMDSIDCPVDPKFRKLVDMFVKLNGWK